MQWQAISHTIKGQVVGWVWFDLTLPLPLLISPLKSTAKTILEGFMFVLSQLAVRTVSIFQHCDECSHGLDSL